MNPEIDEEYVYMYFCSEILDVFNNWTHPKFQQLHNKLIENDFSVCETIQGMDIHTCWIFSCILFYIYIIFCIIIIIIFYCTAEHLQPK